jgi:hypothetical protein
MSLHRPGTNVVVSHSIVRAKPQTRRHENTSSDSKRIWSMDRTNFYYNRLLLENIGQSIKYRLCYQGARYLLINASSLENAFNILWRKPLSFSPGSSEFLKCQEKRRQYIESRAHVMRRAEVILYWCKKRNRGWRSIQFYHKETPTSNYSGRQISLLLSRLLVLFWRSRLSQQYLRADHRHLFRCLYNSPLCVKTRACSSVVMYVRSRIWHQWIGIRMSTFAKTIPLDSSIA